MTFNYVEVAKKGNGSHHLTKFKRCLSSRSPKQNSYIYLTATAGCSEWVSNASDHNRIALFFTHPPPKANGEFALFVSHIYLHLFFWPVVMAWLEEMQACVTVWAGTRSEIPAPSAAWQKEVHNTHANQFYINVRTICLTPSSSSFLFKDFSHKWY